MNFTRHIFCWILTLTLFTTSTTPEVWALGQGASGKGPASVGADPCVGPGQESVCGVSEGVRGNGQASLRTNASVRPSTLTANMDVHTTTGAMKQQVLPEGTTTVPIEQPAVNRRVTETARQGTVQTRIAVVLSVAIVAYALLSLTGALQAYGQLRFAHLLLFNILTSAMCTAALDWTMTYVLGRERYSVGRGIGEAMIGVATGYVFTQGQFSIEQVLGVSGMFIPRLIAFGLLAVVTMCMYTGYKKLEERVFRTQGKADAKIALDVLAVELGIGLVKYPVVTLIPSAGKFLFLQVMAAVSVGIMVWAYNRGTPFLYLYDRWLRLKQSIKKQFSRIRQADAASVRTSAREKMPVLRAALLLLALEAVLFYAYWQFKVEKGFAEIVKGYCAFVVFFTMSNVISQMLSVFFAKKDVPRTWLRAIDWVEVATVFTLVTLVFGWLWQAAFLWWSQFFPAGSFLGLGIFVGLSDQIFTAPLTAGMIFAGLYVMQRFVMRTPVTERKLRENLVSARRMVKAELFFFPVLFYIVFSLLPQMVTGLSFDRQIGIISIAQVPFFIFYFCYSSFWKKKDVGDKRLVMPRPVAVVLAVVLAMNVLFVLSLKFYPMTALTTACLLSGLFVVYAVVIIAGIQERPVVSSRHTDVAVPAQQEQPPAIRDGLERPLQVTGTTLRPKDRQCIALVRDGLSQLIGKGMRVLEVGTGSGVLTKELCDSAPRARNAVFVATDIMPDAVADARVNLAPYEQVDVRQGDLFAPIKAGEYFDVIFWNPPWYSLKGKGGTYKQAMNDPGYVTLKRFLKEVPAYLSERGRVYIVFPQAAMHRLTPYCGQKTVITEKGSYRTKRGVIGLYELSFSRVQIVRARCARMGSETAGPAAWRDLQAAA